MSERKIKPSVEIYKRGLKFEIGIFIVVLVFVGLVGLFALSIESKTSYHLEKYNNAPCINTTFELSFAMRKVIGGPSTMNKGYYHITNNLLQGKYDDYTTVKKTLTVFSHGSKFKVVGYYIAYDAGPLSHLGGGPTPKYLLEHTTYRKEYFWLPYFSFDVNNCNVIADFDGENFNVLKHSEKEKFSKTIIEL